MESQPGTKKKIILWTLAFTATGVITYFGFRWWNQRKRAKENTPDPTIPSLPASSQSSSSYLPPKPAKAMRNDEFPLKRGSKGANVKILQDALIAQYGKQVLPKYGPDGDFGSELEAGLKKVGLPAVIDQNTFNVLTKATSLDPSKTAQALVKAATEKNFKQVIDSLKTLRSKEDYTSVNDIFKNQRISGGVRQTLVNGLLNSFPDEGQKQAIRLEFIRMGLIYDGSKWALSGLDGPSLITTRSTKVYKGDQFIDVPAKTVLGQQVGVQGEYLVFENLGTRFKVARSSVIYV